MMYSIVSNHFEMRRRWQQKEKERNILAAVTSILVIAGLATALAQPRWFHLKGGGCNLKYIGVQEFFYWGYFEASTNPDNTTDIIYHGFSAEMRNCVTPTIVNLLRVIIATCFFAIFASALQFFWDTLGVTSRLLGTLRRNALGSIITVFLCIIIVGVCYYVSTLMEDQQERTKTTPENKVELVKFDISYFLVAGSGTAAILAAAANLLRRRPNPDDYAEATLLDDCSGPETFSIGIPYPDSMPPSYRPPLFMPPMHMPPPPPYTP